MVRDDCRRYLVADPLAVGATRLSTTLVTAIATALLVVVVAGGVVEATTETTTAAAGVGALGSTIDLDLATLELLIVELLDGSIGTVGVSEGDETEATGAASLTISDDDGVDDLADLAESRAEGIVGGVPGQTTNEQLGTGRRPKC